LKLHRSGPHGVVCPIFCASVSVSVAQFPISMHCRRPAPSNRQSARSIHFLTILSSLAFLVVHITLVVMIGFAHNMNHIVLGTNDEGRVGIWLGFVGIGVVAVCWTAVH